MDRREGGGNADRAVGGPSVRAGWQAGDPLPGDRVPVAGEGTGLRGQMGRSPLLWLVFRGGGRSGCGSHLCGHTAFASLRHHEGGARKGQAVSRGKGFHGELCPVEGHRGLVPGEESLSRRGHLDPVPAGGPDCPGASAGPVSLPRPFATAWRTRSGSCGRTCAAIPCWISGFIP